MARWALWWLLAMTALVACGRGTGPEPARAVPGPVSDAPPATEELEASPGAPTLSSSSAEGEGDAGPARSDRSQTGSREVVFEARLMRAPAVPTAADSGTRAWPVGADPRWLLLLHIDAIVEGEAPFQAGTDQAFLIHSPARTFMGDEPAAGSRHRFRATLAAGEGPPRLVTLSLEL